MPYNKNPLKVFKQSYILASRSPRRAQLLKQIGLKYKTVVSNVEELEVSKHNPVNLVKHNSVLKSQKVAEKFHKEIVIGADTVVEINGTILHKPKNLSEARKFLKMLSGKVHFVYTGINVINTKTGKNLFDYERTAVYFRKLTDAEINYYVRNYKPLDKAGAYGIQDDFGCLFIEKISGDYYNIVGLPLVRLYTIIQKVL